MSDSPKRPSGPAFGPTGLDRRRAPRIPIPARGPVSVVGARLINASVFGMVIESLVAMQQDSLMRLRVVIERDKTDVEARVAACTAIAPGTKGAFAIGFEFTALPAAVRAKLQEALDKLPASGPEQRSA